jgi:hypothetical protein
MDDSSAREKCYLLQRSLIKSLGRNIPMENNRDNRLLLKRKTEFLLKSYPSINSFEVICNEENNDQHAITEGYFFITIVVEFEAHNGRHYALTIKV